jgi:hypothetical protein
MGSQASVVLPPGYCHKKGADPAARTFVMVESMLRSGGLRYLLPAAAQGHATQTGQRQQRTAGLGDGQGCDFGAYASLGSGLESRDTR